MRKPPRIVRILGQRIQTFVGLNKPDQMSHAIGHDHKDQAGVALLAHGMVGIESNQSEDQLADTTLHEWLHIMLLMIDHDDEALVFRLAPVLLDFMRRNPRAVEYLMGHPYRVVRW